MPRAESCPTRSRLAPMEPLITSIVGVLGVFVGWGLKTLSEAWTWRRDQVLGAYLQLLDMADRCGPEIGRVWNTGQAMEKRDQAWVDRAFAAQLPLEDVDRATGRVFLVCTPAAARAAIDLYLALERMYRRAIAIPPRSWENFNEASIDMVKAYQRLVDQGRDEIAVRRWRERLGGEPSRFDLTDKKLKELDATDPQPVPEKQAP
jgi:hypothetical protein